MESEFQGTGVQVAGVIISIQDRGVRAPEQGMQDMYGTETDKDFFLLMLGV